MNSGILLGSLHFDLVSFYQIGYIISSEVGSSFKWESDLSASFFSSFSSLPLQSLCIKSSTVGVPHQVAWILYMKMLLLLNTSSIFARWNLAVLKDPVLFCTSISEV